MENVHQRTPQEVQDIVALTLPMVGFSILRGAELPHFGEVVLRFSRRLTLVRVRAELVRLLGFWRWARGSRADRWCWGTMDLHVWREHLVPPAPSAG